MRLLAERLKFYAMLGNGSMLSDRVQPKVRLLCRVGPGNSILLRADEVIE